MRRRSRAGGEPTKTQRRKTAAQKGSIALKAARSRSSSAAREETKVARLTRQRDEALQRQAATADDNGRLLNELRQRTRDLTEALEQQTATSEVLKVISSSQGNLEPVFGSMLENAVGICGASFGAMHLREDEDFRRVALSNAPPQFLEFHKKAPVINIANAAALRRIVTEKRVVQVADLQAEEPDAPLTKYAAARTLLVVPLLKQQEVIGAFSIYRQEVQPFTDKQTALLENFAAQAVIAIENARLLSDLRQRTDELGRSVEELRALGEVSQAVNSTLDLETVLSTIVGRAVQLSRTDAGAIYVFDEEQREFRLHATYGMSEKMIAAITELRIGVGANMGAAAIQRKPIQVPDIRNEPASALNELVFAEGYRSILIVPMLRPDNIVGGLVVRRKTPGEFSKSTIDLLQTFADQSVVAIQNARLFEGVEVRTRELGASLEDLRTTQANLAREHAVVQDKSRQLEMANKQLELADRYKSHFLASASHDLRQPLHALNLFVAQLQTEKKAAERRRLVSRIDAAVASMNELFEALLDMTKLEAGILHANPAEFAVQRLLDRIETTFAELADEKGLSLRVVPCSACVRSDPILLERILFNLVGNAVRYTACGAVVVGCRRRATELRIDVCDTGAGIPEDQRQSIFSEFYQLANPAPDRKVGLGLGLAIVDRLSHLLGHPVQLQSNPGRGSRFSVSVPLAVELGGTVQSPVALHAVDLARGKQVMVIDDDVLVLDGMRGMLQSWGCHVQTAASGTTALVSVVDGGAQPDLIISDLRLADGESGIDVIERLREAMGAPIPAFVISGDTAPERLREASACGYHLLQKPVSPMTLRATLNRLLKSSEARAASPHAQVG